jgi:hypothetical protein
MNNKMWIVAQRANQKNRRLKVANVDHYLVDFNEDHYSRLLSCLSFS